MLSRQKIFNLIKEQKKAIERRIVGKHVDAGDPGARFYHCTLRWGGRGGGGDCVSPVVVVLALVEVGGI